MTLDFIIIMLAAYMFARLFEGICSWSNVASRVIAALAAIVVLLAALVALTSHVPTMP